MRTRGRMFFVRYNACCHDLCEDGRGGGGESSGWWPVPVLAWWPNKESGPAHTLSILLCTLVKGHEKFRPIKRVPYITTPAAPTRAYVTEFRTFSTMHHLTVDIRDGGSGRYTGSTTLNN
jgi:hypothetical protein